MAELANPVEIKASGAALIGDGGVIKPVAENDLFVCEGWEYDFLDMLGSVGKEEEELGAGRDVFFIMMEKEMTDELACHGPAGCTGQKNRFFLLFKIFIDLLNEGAFSGTFSAFKRDEQLLMPPAISSIFCTGTTLSPEISSIFWIATTLSSLVRLTRRTPWVDRPMTRRSFIDIRSVCPRLDMRTRLSCHDRDRADDQAITLAGDNRANSDAAAVGLSKVFDFGSFAVAVFANDED